MHFRTKTRAANERHMVKPRDRADRPPSTAWLAAQEAFSAPRPGPVETALVVVRKGRAPELVLHGDAASAAAATAAVNIPVERPARVFRVVATNTVVAAPAADPGLPAPSGVLPEPAPAARPAATAPAPRRRRRVDVDKHPGPVKHILQPAAARIERAAEPAAETPVHGLSPGEEIAALQAAMARLDAVFDEISRARAFRVLG